MIRFIFYIINLGKSRDAFVAQFLRSPVRAWRPDSFISLWAAFTLTVHINSLNNESIHGKEEHAS